MIRLALIGCGAHSEACHARPLAHFARLHPGVASLTAACDTNIERAHRFCKEYGFARAYGTTAELLDAGMPDAVVSVLPIQEIAGVGSLLLRRGIPCVLEKPPGRSMAEVSALAEVARRTGTPHMVSMNRRFNPYLNRALDWTRSAGPLLHIRGRMLRHARRESDFLWGTGVHILDAVRYVAGEVELANTKQLDHNGQSAPWYVITLRFASGCTGCIEIFPSTGSVLEEIELFGEGFRAHVRTMGESGESVRCWKDATLDVEIAADPSEPAFLRDGSYEEASYFLSAVRDASPLYPSLDDVLPSLELCRQM